MNRKWPSPEKRLQSGSKIDPNTGCWLWQKKPQSSGYGTIMINYKWWLVHRLSYSLLVGPLLEGQLVLHKCDVRMCINPDHLFVGTQKHNLEDMYKKKRGPIRDGKGVFRSCSSG